jgi:hypothetical protein
MLSNKGSGNVSLGNSQDPESEKGFGDCWSLASAATARQTGEKGLLAVSSRKEVVQCLMIVTNNNVRW